MPADHPRKIIRNAIASRIATPLPDESFWTPAGERVFSSKPTTIDPLELPCIVVRTLDETVEETGVSEFCTYRRRELRLSIDCLAEAYDDVEDTLDDLAYGVELSLEGFMIPSFEDAKIELSRTDIDTSLEGDLPMGAARVQFTINYQSVYEGVDFGFTPVDDLNKDCDRPPGVCLDPAGVTKVSTRTFNSFDPTDSPEPATSTILEE
jgi:hypothetical protein